MKHLLLLIATYLLIITSPQAQNKVKDQNNLNKYNNIDINAKSSVLSFAPYTILNKNEKKLNQNSLKIITTYDYPPFVYLREDGKLAGFEVELLKEICKQINVVCSIQQYPYDALEDMLSTDSNIDIVAAGLRADKITGSTYIPSQVYYRQSGNFITLIEQTDNLNKQLFSLSTEENDEKLKIGVVESSAHLLMLKKYFQTLEIIEFQSIGEGLEQLKQKSVDAFFGDKTQLSFLIQSEMAENCCELGSGPYYDYEILGSGISLAVNHKNKALLPLVNSALSSLANNGELHNLFLKYFP